MFVLCIWLIDLTVGELKSSQIRQSGEHDIEFSAYPEMGTFSIQIGTGGVSPYVFFPNMGTILCSHEATALKYIMSDTRTGLTFGSHTC